MTRVLVLTVNHGTTAHTDLMLRTLLTRQATMSEIDVLVMDNGSTDQARLEWAVAEWGVRIRQSGHGVDDPENTHGEIMRRAILDEPDVDAYLVVDSDICFIEDDTVRSMRALL